jgi:hypothetical protein
MIEVKWTEQELIALAKEAGMTISEEDFKVLIWSFSHAENMEREIREAGNQILLDIFLNRWSLRLRAS